MSPFVRDPEVEAAASTRLLVLLCYSMLAGQQPPRVARVCVQLARSRRVECGRTAAAGCSQFGLAEMQRVARWCWVGWALPDGARAQPQGSGAQAYGE